MIQLMDVLEMLKKARSGVPAPVISDDPHQALFDKILRDGPQSRDEWGFYIENHISPILEEQFGQIYDIRGALIKGHTSPVDAGWKVYCTAIGRNTKFQQLSAKELRKVPKKIVFHAPRGGSKTLDLAIIAFTLSWFHAGYSISYTATQDQQVDQAWDYFRAFSAKTIKEVPNWFASKIIKAVKGKIEFTNKSNIWRVSCTPDGLNSKHPNMFIIDEVETANWNTVIEGLFSGQARMAQNRPMMYIFASTQKQPRATMFYLFRMCVAGKARLMRWNWKSVVEKCMPDRRDTLQAGLKCEHYGPLADRASELTSNSHRSIQDEHELLKVSHELDILLENCWLVSRCQGIAKKGRGYKSIDDLIEFLEADEQAFDAQMGCEQPNMKNAVYSSLTSANADLGVMYNPGAEQSGYVDYGYSLDPTAVGVCNIIGSSFEQWYEAEYRIMDEDTLVPILKELGFRFSIERWAVSPEANQLKRKMIEAGLNIFTRKLPIAAGVGNMAHFVKTGRGVVKFKVNPRMCPKTWEQLQTYYKAPSGEPTKVRQNNHHWDFCEGLRYFANMLRDDKPSDPVELRKSWRNR